MWLRNFRLLALGMEIFEGECAKIKAIFMLLPAYFFKEVMHCFAAYIFIQFFNSVL